MTVKPDYRYPILQDFSGLALNIDILKLICAENYIPGEYLYEC